MARAKICGTTTPADARAAVDAGADAVGVVADVPVDTPREVDAATAAAVLAAVPPFVTGTLVTMPERAPAAAALAERVGADAVQIHGDFAPAALGDLRAEAGVPVLPVVDGGAVERAEELDAAGAADALVVDTPSEDGGGGTGRTHDWDATAALAAAVDCPVVLAGGLTPENVADAVASVDPYAVDVASGVERAGGRKDHDAVRRFVRAAAGGEVATA
jgi:phosphoribosylanthranilate isomerase